MNSTHFLYKLTTFSAVALLSPSCSESTEDSLEVAIYFEDSLSNPVDTGIALSSKIKLAAKSRSGSEPPVDLTDVVSSDPSVLAVLNVTEDTVVLEARKVGTAKVTFTAKKDGAQGEEVLQLEVVDPPSVDFSLPCSGSTGSSLPPYRFMTESDVILNVDKGSYTTQASLSPNSDDRIVGFDYKPITFMPSDMLRASGHEGSGLQLHYKSRKQSGLVTISSARPMAEVTLDIIDRKEINDFQMRPSLTTQQVNTRSVVLFFPSTPEKGLIHSPISVRLKNNTPQICTIELGSDQRGCAPYYNVSFNSSGICTYEATSQVTGTKKSFSLTVK